MEKKIEEFVDFLREEERSENTIDTYVHSVKKYFELFNEITKKNMIEYKKHMISSYAPKTASNRCIAMNQFCKFVGKSDCMVKTIKIQKTLCVENVPTLEEYNKLLSILLENGDERNYWLIKYLAKTGARVSEVIQFEKKHLEKGEVEIWTKGKIRKIYIPQNLIEESREYFSRDQEQKYLFPNVNGKQSTTRGIASRIHKMAKYGFRPEMLHPHAFRHLYAIEFLKRNGDISLLSSLMGHESIDTTAIYLRRSAEDQKRSLNDAMNW